jgi:hypothetical protein
MYALVYKNRVIVGPMDWNRGIFNFSLEKEKIKAYLPRIAPSDEELPLVINSDAKIMRAEEIKTNISPMVEYYYGPLWDLTGTKAIANYEVHDIPLDSAKSNFKDLAAKERWKKEIKGTKITLQDIEVYLDTTREGRLSYIQKFNSIGENDSINWKFANLWINLTKNELGQIISACESHVQSCFDWEKSIADQIDSCNSKEELLAIEIVPDPSLNQNLG